MGAGQGAAAYPVTVLADGLLHAREVCLHLVPPVYDESVVYHGVPVSCAWRCIYGVRKVRTIQPPVGFDTTNIDGPSANILNQNSLGCRRIF